MNSSMYQFMVRLYHILICQLDYVWRNIKLKWKWNPSMNLSWDRKFHNSDKMCFVKFLGRVYLFWWKSVQNRIFSNNFTLVDFCSDSKILQVMIIYICAFNNTWYSQISISICLRIIEKGILYTSGLMYLLILHTL